MSTDTYLLEEGQGIRVELQACVLLAEVLEPCQPVSALAAPVTPHHQVKIVPPSKARHVNALAPVAPARSEPDVPVVRL